MLSGWRASFSFRSHSFATLRRKKHVSFRKNTQILEIRKVPKDAEYIENIRKFQLFKAYLAEKDCLCYNFLVNIGKNQRKEG